MRQTGFVSSVAGYGVINNISLLPHVHSLAKKLEAGLKELGATVLTRAETYMLSYDPSPLGISLEDIAERAISLQEPLYLSGSRLVVHVQTSDKAVDDFLGVIRDLAVERKTQTLKY